MYPVFSIYDDPSLIIIEYDSLSPQVENTPLNPEFLYEIGYYEAMARHIISEVSYQESQARYLASGGSV